MYISILRGRGFLKRSLSGEAPHEVQVGVSGSERKALPPGDSGAAWSGEGSPTMLWVLMGRGVGGVGGGGGCGGGGWDEYLIMCYCFYIHNPMLLY